jgi:gas vesicle protein
LQGAKQRGTELEDKLAAKSKELSETQQNLAKLISQLNETKSSSELMGHVQSQKTELLDKLQS